MNNIIKKRYRLYKILITLLTLYSCENRVHPLKIDYLKGSWKLSQDDYYIKYDSLLSLSSSTDLFSFFTIDKDNKAYSLNFSYSGNCTVDLQQMESKYHIKADTLQLYDMKNDFFYNLKIVSLSENTMCLKNQYEDLFNGLDTVTFIKVQKSKLQLDYDKIIVQQYMYNLFSNCRKNIFYILNKNGTFQIAKNGENKDELSFLTYGIPKSQVDSIFDNFQYVNFNDLSNKYISGKSSEDVLYFKVFF